MKLTLWMLSTAALAVTCFAASSVSATSLPAQALSEPVCRGRLETAVRSLLRLENPADRAEAAQRAVAGLARRPRPTRSFLVAGASGTQYYFNLGTAGGACSLEANAYTTFSSAMDEEARLNARGKLAYTQSLPLDGCGCTP